MYILSKIIPILILLFFLNGCQGGKFFKRSDIKDNPVNVDERVQKNIEEGRGIRFSKLGNSGGTFDFASSNNLWRATVETLDFVPLINASYSGGIIITDWFNGGSEDNQNRSLKITVKFLSNEIRSDAVKVDVHERICNNQNNCTTQLIKSKVSGDIKLAILKKAAFMEKNKVADTIKKNKKKKFIPDD
jgi:hypothetical protein